MKKLIFDLDQTLVDTSICEDAKKNRNWDLAYEQIESCKLYDGMDAVFKAIKDNDIKMCIVSSSPSKFTRLVVEKFHIPADCIVAYHDTVKNKPSPAPMLLALEKLGCSADEAISFGDKDSDFVSAFDAGIESVACLWGIDDKDKANLLHSCFDYMIDKPTEILDLIMPDSPNKQSVMDKSKKYAKIYETAKNNPIFLEMRKGIRKWNVNKNCLKYKSLHLYFHKDTPKDVMEANDPEHEHNYSDKILSFKNYTTLAIGSEEHKRYLESLELFANQTCEMIARTFGENAKRLTFVCIPAATRIRNERRFKEFSSMVCERLGMENGYQYARIVKNGRPSSIALINNEPIENRIVEFDPQFFKNKYVVLFDDIKTFGKKLNEAKTMLESIGAYVVCGITLSQTFHPSIIDSFNKNKAAEP